MRANIKQQTNTDRYSGSKMQTEKSMKNFSISDILGATQNMGIKEQDALAVHTEKILMMN